MMEVMYRLAAILLVTAGCGRLGFDPMTANNGGTDAAGDGGASNIWTTPPSTTGAPSGRSMQSAVWAGSEMIVWGGHTAGWNIRDDGARYDPSTDSWRSMAQSGSVLLPRGRHASVWTGTEMIVWGGDDGNVEGVATGARYRPASDTWGAPLSTTNAPDGRVYAGVAWTGTEMLIWGGNDNVQLFDNGGRYRADTNTWGPALSQVGAPSARNCPATTWTGSEMFVWGGWDTTNGDRWLDTGARYNPTTDTWRPISTVGAPAPRTCATAIWTGTEVIVWGGGDGTQFENGGRYDPATNTWSPTLSTTNAPAGRWGHSAVWTGTEMIVWGGDTTNGGWVYANGGRFVP
jgi:hypothetical protein